MAGYRSGYPYPAVVRRRWFVVQEGAMATVKEFVRKGLPPQTHAYDDPDLSPVEFLQAVYRATHLPMSIRIDAARGALPFTEQGPRALPLLDAR